MRNETVIKTLAVAATISVICSILVSSAAVLLRSNQEKNKELDMKKNILMSAGLMQKGVSVEDKYVEELFEKIEIKVVDLATGEFNEDIDPNTFDQRKAAKSEADGLAIDRKNDLATIKRRSKNALVYLARDEQGRLQQVIIPVHGMGLWSTMYGFMALDADTTTIKGFAFYHHGETPGLGGEVDNPQWIAQWVGKKAFDDNWKPRIEVIKGKVRLDSPDAHYQVDGLSGATITSRGVKNLLQYWLGDRGFGPFLSRVRAEEGGQDE